MMIEIAALHCSPRRATAQRKEMQIRVIHPATVFLDRQSLRPVYSWRDWRRYVADSRRCGLAALLVSTTVLHTPCASMNTVFCTAYIKERSDG